VPPPKLHLNENLSPRLAVQLRKLGFDVTSTLELGMTEVDDDAQLAFALPRRKERSSRLTTRILPFAMHDTPLRARNIGASFLRPKKTLGFCVIVCCAC